MDIGLVLMISDRKDLGRPYSWAETRDLAQRAEGRRDLTRSGSTIICSIASRTSRPPASGMLDVPLRAGRGHHPSAARHGRQLRALPNPAILAKMAVTLDEVSNGRFILGLGAGWNAAEFAAFGLPFDHRMSRFEEAVKIIKPLLTDGRVDFEGTYYTARDCELAPRGPRPHGPPLLFGTQGPRGLRLTAQYGDLWNSAYASDECRPPGSARPARGRLPRRGRDPATLPRTTTVAITFPDLGGPEKLEYDSLTGTPEHLAERFLAFATLGIAHIMLEAHPYSAATVDRLAEAARIIASAARRSESAHRSGSRSVYWRHP